MKKHCLLLTLLSTMCICHTAHAQFTQPLTTPPKEATIDSIKVESAPKVNMTIYSEAYQRYLKSFRFKERNKIIIKNTGLTITQAMLDNWAAGGANSLSARLYMNIAHTYTNQSSFNLISSFEGALSMVKSNGMLTKSEDWWRLNIKPSWKIAKKWSFSGDVMLNSQFASSFHVVNDSVSNFLSSFMSPATFTVSAGFTYNHIKDKNNLKLYIAPASGNLKMVLNEDLAAKGSFGLEPGQKFKPTFGILFRTEYSTKLAKDKVDLYTKLESFWNYDSDPTIYWENRLVFRLTNLLSLNFTFISKYDRNVNTPRIAAGGTDFWDYWQVNESFGLAFAINYTSKTPKKINVENLKPLTYK